MAHTHTIASAGWLVSVRPIQEGSEPIHYAAAFKHADEAELAVVDSPEGRGKRVLILRSLNVIEMMHLRMKPGEIRRHD